MAEKKTNTVTINGADHNYDDLNDTQKVFLEHTADLERKIRSAQFNLNQLQVGREAFLNMLTASLASEPEEAEVVN
jgi:hypothetical protein